MPCVWGRFTLLQIKSSLDHQIQAGHICADICAGICADNHKESGCRTYIVQPCISHTYVTLQWWILTTCNLHCQAAADAMTSLDSAHKRQPCSELEASCAAVILFSMPPMPLRWRPSLQGRHDPPPAALVLLPLQRRSPAAGGICLTDRVCMVAYVLHTQLW
jgi:hypothetical protein